MARDLRGALRLPGASGRPLIRILFTGYARVHFACFRPLYERLAERSDIELRVSGGLRSLQGERLHHDAAAMYAPFDLAADALLTVEQIAQEDFDILFCANTKAITPRSVGRTVQIFHGLSFRNRSARSANSSHDHYFMVGPYMKRRFAELGVLEPDDVRALEVGFPKTDRLCDGSLDRGELLARHGLTGDRPVLLYAPTGAAHNSLETMGEALIGRIAASGAYDLLVKPHDHPKGDVDWFERLAPLTTDRVRLVRDPDVIPLLYLADALITDASSVAYEYSLLDRPIVFLDVPDLLAKAAGDGRLDMRTWGRRAGDIAADPGQAMRMLDRAIEQPGRHAEIRRAMARDLFYNPGEATDVALQCLDQRILAEVSA